MLPKGVAKKVTIYLNQDTPSHIEPLWSAILGFLRHKHVAGATLARADAGFGTHEQFHNQQSEYIAEYSPIRIEFIETQQRVDELLPALYDMVTDGLITVQGLTVIKAVAKDARARPAPLENSKRIVTVPALEGYGETTELHHPHLFSERFAHSHHYCRAAGEGPANLARAAKHDEQRIHCGHRG